MDPIKVDFTGNGAKSNSVVIPPNKSRLKTIISIVGTVVAAIVAYYFYLPAFNFKAIEMYIYFGIVIIAYCVISFITSGAVAAPEYAPYARKKTKIPMLIIVALGLLVGVGFLISSAFFRASSYHNIITIDVDKEGTKFQTEIDEADTDYFQNVPMLDEESAAMLADKALSDLANNKNRNLVSQFTVYPTNTQINLNAKPVRIATLKYSNIIKWFTNHKKTGLPGYLVIDMTTQKVEYREVKGGIKYSNADHFGQLLKRHLRFKYPTELLGEAVFEVDEEGRPWWVCPVLDKKIFPFGGTDVKGVILVDPNTGDCFKHDIDEVKTGKCTKHDVDEKDKDLSWIDHVYDSDLLVQQYNYYGKYVKGFWNSILGQSEVTITSSGYNYLAKDDDVWMYSGITSINANDNSITGFVLINQRTKEAKYYRASGATENAAQNAAQGKVQQYKYTATFPLLLNIGGEPTYFMALKDDSQIVQQYALVNVKQFTTLLTTGTTIKACLESYLALPGISANIDTNAVDTPTDPEQTDEGLLQTVSGVVTDVKTAVINGNSMYYLKLDTDVYYAVSAAKFESVIIAAAGSQVEITYKETDEKIIPATSFELK